ncbi:MAG: hypothetical protein R3360_03680 [Alphaproteobacteria bacterium]|nr:hypothetical protein [Alphaproteobacteria bacterium]
MEINRTRPIEENSFRTPSKRPLIGVMGGTEVDDPALPAQVGRMLASLGTDLLTGAGSGTMEIVSRAFYEAPGRRGLVIGVVPGIQIMDDDDFAYRTRTAAYPNDYVEVAIFTHLPTLEDLEGPTSRNHVNVLSSDAIIVLPGNDGTYAELKLAAFYCKPVCVWMGSSGHILGQGLETLQQEFPDHVVFAETLADVEAFCRETLNKLGYVPSLS